MNKAALAWPEFLRTLTFAPKDFANLAIRPFKWKAQHTLTAIAAVLALAGCALTYAYVSDRIRAHHIAIAVNQHRLELEHDIAKLEATEKRYHEAEALIAAVPTANPKPSGLLDAVTQALPPALQLLTYRYQSGQFTLEGIAYEGIGQDKGPYATFLDALGSGSRPWTLKTPKAALASSTWTLNGTVNP